MIQIASFFVPLRPPPFLRISVLKKGLSREGMPDFHHGVKSVRHEISDTSEISGISPII